MNQRQKLILFLGVPALLCCTCTGGLATWGMTLYRADVCDQLETRKAISERIGQFNSCSVDFTRSMNLNDLDTFVFDVKGQKGSGRVYVKSENDDQGNEKLLGVLLVFNGEEVLVEGDRPSTK